MGARGATTWMAVRALALSLALGASIAGCGSTSTSTSTVNSGVVTIVVTSPTSGSVIAGANVVVRGTVSPANATVQVQGKPAAVGNGVFTGTATLHGGKTTIDVIGSAPGATPGATTVAIVQQSTASGHSKARKGTKATPNVAGQTGASGQTSCGGGLAVGPDTTCVFAESVRSAYRESGGSSTVVAYSTVTNKAYEMTCVTHSGEVVCTGGIGAAVYFSQ